MKRELKSDFYDNAYSRLDKYNCSYEESPYFNIWSWIYGKLDLKDKIVDFGCGTGQLCEFLFDYGLNISYGVDFSSVAVEKANNRVPFITFFQGNLYDKDVYNGNYDTAICLEVLEHLADDYKFFDNLSKGTKIIISVPNFDSKSHIRYFKDLKDAKNRYKDVMRISGGKTFTIGKNEIYVIYGRK